MIYVFAPGYLGGTDDRTFVQNSTLLSSALPSLLSSRVEQFSVRKYEENGEKQRKGMLSVLEMLREKSVPKLLVPLHFTFPIVLGERLMVVGIDRGVHWHSL